MATQSFTITVPRDGKCETCKFCEIDKFKIKKVEHVHILCFHPSNTIKEKTQFIEVVTHRRFADFNRGDPNGCGHSAKFWEEKPKEEPKPEPETLWKRLMNFFKKSS